jgi:hypothetical protein
LPTLAVVLITACAAACATAEPVVRLTPREPVQRWHQGRAVLVRSAAGVQVALAYDRNVDDLVAFRLEVRNLRQADLLVDPRHVTGTLCRPAPGATAPLHCWARVAFVNPESMAAQVEVSRAQAQAGHQNEQSWLTGLLFLSLAADVAHVSRGRLDRSDTLEVATRMDAASARHGTSELRFGSALEFWQSATLRRTTLSPGQAVSGLVLMRRRPEAPTVVVEVALADQRFWFHFDQRVLNRPHSTPR